MSIYSFYHKLSWSAISLSVFERSVKSS